MARLIDADVLKDRFRRRLEWLEKDVYDEYTKGLYHGCEYDIKLIDEPPTVDAVPVMHGHWEDAHEIKSFRHTNIPVVKCSKCECYFCDIINNHHWFYHYCPNCGATMDGDGNV